MGDRLGLRVGRVADVGDAHRRSVDASDGDGGAVRTPPIAAKPPHLFGRYEIGAAPRDGSWLVVAAGHYPRRAVEGGDAEDRSRCVGDAAPGRVGAGVEDRALDEQLPRLTGVQVGGVLAYLAGKVLGQYEVFSRAPGELLLVAPNIVATERSLGADPRDFRLWVCLHEVTHRTQFTAVPWLRDHFLQEVFSFVDAADPDDVRERLSAAAAEVARAVRERDTELSIIDLVQTPEQKAVLDRLTALMTLLEGHAEYVMNGVGPMVVPSVESITAKFQARRKGTGPIDRALRRLLGIDVKMRQYAEVSRFVADVVGRAGMDGFNRVWDSPHALPTTAEIGDPQAWIARLHGTAPTENG